MESFEILRASHIAYSEVIGQELKNPLLFVDVSFQRELIFFIYCLNDQMEWTFKEFRFSDGDLSNQSRLFDNMHHLLQVDKKMYNGTFNSFNNEMNALAPILLNHPKIRLKAILLK